MSFITTICLFVINVIYTIATIIVLGMIFCLFTEKRWSNIGKLFLICIPLSIILMPIEHVYNNSVRPHIESVHNESVSLFNSGNVSDAEILLSETIDKHKCFENIDDLENTLEGMRAIKNADELFVQEDYIKANTLYLDALKYNFETKRINNRLNEISTVLADSSLITKEEESNVDSEKITDSQESNANTNNSDTLSDGSIGISTLDGSVTESPSKILGSTKDEILLLFSGYSRSKKYEQNIDPNAVKFENNNMSVVVTFDGEGIAEGVSFLSNDIGDIITGENSYTHRNYEYLINLATGGEDVRIEHNTATEYPVEIYIGNVHE